VQLYTDESFLVRAVTARPCLDSFMRDGGPDRDAFRDTVIPMLDRIAAAGHDRLRLFGEMVNLLWADDLPAAVRLEDLWSELIAERRLSFLCAYRIACCAGLMQAEPPSETSMPPAPRPR
jgi:MEDS: MEthanogen/methylotroph, DcmR Sensory domain